MFGDRVSPTRAQERFMWNFTRCALAVVTLFVAGCTGNSPAPTQPSVTQSNQSPSFPISGYVTDTAGRPIEGAKVEVTDGARAGTSTTTNAMGAYSMPGEFVGAKVTITASKTSYIASSVVGTPYNSNRGSPLTLSLVTYFTLQSTTASPDFSGDYLLTLAPSSSCNPLPADIGIRTYSARIKSTSLYSFVGTINDAALVGGYNTFYIAVAGDFVSVGVASGYDSEYPGIVESLGEKGYWAISGDGGASTSAGSSGITVPLSGSVEYCPRDRALVIGNGGLGNQYQCSHATPVTAVTCTATNHMLTLTKQ
jgi:hypothetical protein